MFQSINSDVDAKSLVRCSPGEDATNGFFVSCFVRQQDNSKKRKGSPSQLGEDQNIMASRRKKKKKKAGKPTVD